MARYGPRDRYGDVPGAGMCLSAFAIVRRGGKVLAGRPRLGPKWTEEWWASFPGYSPEEQAALREQWKFPSTYLREGEHPEAALDRVMRTQLGARTYDARALEIGSWTAKSDWYPGQKHWDLAFLYDVTGQLPARTPRWWRELGWFTPAELRRMDFGWNQDLVRDLAPLPKARR